MKPPRVRSYVPPSSITTRRQFDRERDDSLIVSEVEADVQPQDPKRKVKRIQTTDEDNESSSDRSCKKQRKMIPTPDCPSTSKHLDPFLHDSQFYNWKSNEPSRLPESYWKLMEQSILPTPLQLWYYEEGKSDGSSEYFFRLRNCKSAVQYTIGVVVADIDNYTVCLRVFYMNTVLHSGILLDTLAWFFRKRKYKYFFYQWYKDGHDGSVLKYLEYLVSTCQQWRKKGKDYYLDL
jgi:hypothetical protein